MEITKDFQFSGIPYDQKGTVRILLSGAGRFTVETESELTSEEEEKMSGEFVKAVALMYEKVLAPMNMDYRFLALTPAEFAGIIKEVVSETWPKRGWELKRAHFTELYPDDDSVAKLIELKSQQERERREQERIEQEKQRQEQEMQRQEQQMQQPQAVQQVTWQQPQPQQPQAQPQSLWQWITQSFQQPQQPVQQPQQYQQPFWQQPQQAPDPSKRIICPRCGADMSGSGNDAKFCSKCGAELAT